MSAGLLQECVTASRGVLRELDFPTDGTATPGQLRTFFLTLLGDIVEAAFATAPERRVFLRYQRDGWIRLRSLPVLQGRELSGRILARYEAAAAQLSAAQSAQIAALRSASDASAPWRQRLDTFWRRQDPRASHTDPCAPDALHAALFGLLRAIAAQVGLALLEAGLAGHLQLHARGGAVGERFRWLPIDPTDAPPRPAPRAPGDGDYDFERQYDWLDLVATLGAKGAEWQRFYLDRHRGFQDLLESALVALRQRRLEEGRSLLAEVDQLRSALRAEDEALYWVLGRFYHGAVSYLHYLNEDFPQAIRHVTVAHQAITEAVREAPHLLPFAAVSLDIPLKKARLFRAQAAWEVMDRELRALQGMIAGELPLCTDRDGSAVTLATIHRAVADAKAGPRHAQTLRFLSDPRWRAGLHDAYVQRLYLPLD